MTILHSCRYTRQVQIKIQHMEKENEFLQLEDEIIKILKNIYDPEIPVNIYDLGLIYEIDVDDDDNVRVKMTLTTPNCPIADSLIAEVQHKIEAVEGVKSVNLKLTFDPPWDENMLTEEARLELGLL
jgi:FeS assembly SUF system protein